MYHFRVCSEQRGNSLWYTCSLKSGSKVGAGKHRSLTCWSSLLSRLHKRNRNTDNSSLDYCLKACTMSHQLYLQNKCFYTKPFGFRLVGLMWCSVLGQGFEVAHVICIATSCGVATDVMLISRQESTTLLCKKTQTLLGQTRVESVA